MEALPDEILHKIFAELEDQMALDKWQLYGSRLDHRGSATLGHLCLVCRQFQRIAQPFLYRTIIIEGRDGARNISTLLLRTLVENPQLAEQVRAVSLTDSVKHSAQVKILGEDSSRKVVRSAVEKLDLPPVLKRLMEENIASCGFAALILAYTPHVQVVDCTMGNKKTVLPWLLSASPDAGRPVGYLVDSTKSDFSDDEDYVADYMNRENPEAYQEQKGISKGTFANYCFANLTEIRIRAVEGPKNVEVAWGIEPVLLNSTVKTLRIFGTAWYGDELDYFVWPEHKNYNLEYFDLMESYVDAEGLRTILTRCLKLKGISIRLPDGERKTPILWGLDLEEDEEDCILNFDDFGDVLRRHGQDLEEFDFNTFFFESYSTYYRNRGPGEGMIGSLQQLKSLHHLKVTKEALIGEVEPLSRLSEILPEAIETLHLYCSGIWNIEEWVESEREPYNQDVYKLLLDGMLDLREIRMERCNTDLYNYGRFDSDSDSDSDAVADDNDACFSGDDPEGLYKPQYGPEEYIYSKEAEWPAELHVDGWVVDIVEERLYKIRGRPACNFRVITLSRKT
ncbi:hypothetical protein FAGAP_2032 [Fusarium agapanthi]|uniref:F-box domain-containing protein n=1 Tax=Fusarium agapanthi TaxID=1803897 RepID=A0A9P5E9T7_9HYPO|nr:hypothetical protein FAGAP_2032 [Fusarium agapanthi]